MIPPYIDSHAHLFIQNYEQDQRAVLARARSAGVKAIIIPGTDLKTSQEAVKLAETEDNIFACVGIHPHEAGKAATKDLAEIEELSSHPKVIAIGEIGLDYYYNFSPRDTQKEIFIQQIELSIRKKLPIVIHTRESMDDTIAIIKRTVSEHPSWMNDDNDPQRGVFHCFPGTAEEAKILFELGFYVSFPGIVTFKKSSSLEVVRNIGIRHVLLETDSPYLAPEPMRGKRNEPAYITFIGKIIADALNISEMEVASKTTKNAVRLFRLPLQADKL